MARRAGEQREARVKFFSRVFSRSNVISRDFSSLAMPKELLSEEKNVRSEVIYLYVW